MAKNHRQAYAVNVSAGHQHSAASWGTGRAVARVPRVSGSGTHRAGQGAFANMCRKGRMFAPTKIWRRWHRPINLKQRRFAICSAIAASAIPSLVMARGHKINRISEIPLVVGSAIESITKTKMAVEFLAKIHADSDVKKAEASKRLRAGKGKMRDRRFTMKRGPLLVYAEDKGVVKAFRNIPAIETCHVDRLNLLQLAPGGHMGRFVIWTEGAFARLDALYGSLHKTAELKKDFHLPVSIMNNPDLSRIINSDEVQSVLRPAKLKRTRRAPIKKNPLRNLYIKWKMNPYAKTIRRHEMLIALRREEARKKNKILKRKPITPARKTGIKKQQKRVTDFLLQ
jgi:large subunit ribosomal protein L4e